MKKSLLLSFLSLLLTTNILAELCDNLVFDTKESLYTLIDSSCLERDSCEQLETPGLVFLMPVTDPEFTSIEYSCMESCLDLATPDDLVVPNGSCDFSQSPTVWFEIQTDALAEQLLTVVSTDGTWDPMWSVFYGACDNLYNAADGNVPPCSNGDNTPFFHQTNIEPGFNSFYVAVTADPNGPPIDNPTFEICAATIINSIVCLGNAETGCGEADSTLIIEVTEREFNGPLTGPFCPGEEVDIHIEFFYDATHTGADWFHGFCPGFGQGWDMEEFDFVSNAPFGNGNPGEWHEEGPCAATIAEGVSHLSTYRDNEGVLKICNSLCETCITPQSGMSPGDTLPNGYFWLSNGSNEGCVSNSCSPAHNWGIGSTTGWITWDFTLKVKEFATIDECMEKNDLQISFQTFSDGVAGCWEDPTGECLIDYKQFGPYWQIGCTIDQDTSYIDTLICEGTTITIGGETYGEEGVYTQVTGGGMECGSELLLITITLKDCNPNNCNEALWDLHLNPTLHICPGQPNPYVTAMQAACEFEYYRLKVVNVIGQTIYKTFTPGEFWDGTTNSVSPFDLYIYHLVYRLPGGQTEVLSGMIVVNCG